MRFTEKNSIYEFGKLNHCIQATRKYGEITEDDAESLAFFLELVKEALVSRSMANA